MPVLTIFAGPNGSGKSSLIRRAGFAGRENLLEPDAIASRINTQHPRLAAIGAGREVFRRTQAYFEEGKDFAIETTLSGTWTTRAIENAQLRNFFVRLVYVCVDTPEIGIQRVHQRVAQGGHDVPDADVRRRYVRRITGLKQVVRIVDHAILYDNSAAEPEFVLEFRSGVIARKAPQMLPWALAVT